MVCGEALIDLVAEADGRLRPAPGGGPFNTARALARLGVPTAFLGRLSTDAFGRQLAALLEGDGVDMSLAGHGDEPTTVAVARLDAGRAARYDFYHRGTSAPNLTPAMVPAKLGHDVEALHVGSLGLVLEPMASTLFELIRRERAGRAVMLDPNVRPALVSNAGVYRSRLESAMANGAIVKASVEDVGWIYPGVEIELAAARMLASGARLVVITLGAAGAAGFSRRGGVRVPAPAVEVADTIGAGDAFGAALLAWLHERELLAKDLRLDGPELETALEFACRVASFTCSRGGADPPRRNELGLA